MHLNEQKFTNVLSMFFLDFGYMLYVPTVVIYNRFHCYELHYSLLV